MNNRELMESKAVEMLNMMPFPAMLTTGDQKILVVNRSFQQWWRLMDGEHRGVMGRRFSGVFKVVDEQDTDRLFDASSMDRITQVIMQPRRKNDRRLQVFVRVSKLSREMCGSEPLFCVLVKERESFGNENSRVGLLLHEMRAKSLGKVVAENAVLLNNQLDIARSITLNMEENPAVATLQQALDATQSSVQLLQRMVIEQCLGFGAALQNCDISAGLGKILAMRQTLFGNTVEFIPAEDVTEIVELKNCDLYCTILDILLAFVDHAGSRSRAEIKVQRAEESLLGRSGLPRNITGYSEIRLSFICGDDITARYIAGWFGSGQPSNPETDQGEKALAQRLSDIAAECGGLLMVDRQRHSIEVSVVLPRSKDVEKRPRMATEELVEEVQHFARVLAIGADEQASARYKEQLGLYGFQVETLKDMQVRPAAVVKNIVNHSQDVLVADASLGREFIEDVCAGLDRRKSSCGVLIVGSRPAVTADKRTIRNLDKQASASQMAREVANMLIAMQSRS